MPNSAPPYVSF